MAHRAYVMEETSQHSNFKEMIAKNKNILQHVLKYCIKYKNSQLIKMTWVGGKSP